LYRGSCNSLISFNLLFISSSFIFYPFLIIGFGLGGFEVPEFFPLLLLEVPFLGGLIFVVILISLFLYKS
jgi:hypothetical protein